MIIFFNGPIKLLRHLRTLQEILLINLNCLKMLKTNGHSLDFQLDGMDLTEKEAWFVYIHMESKNYQAVSMELRSI